jgi:hypothetical protein
MKTRVDNLNDLREAVLEGKPGETLYVLGEGEKRKGILVRYIDRRNGDNSYSAKVTKSPMISLRRDNGEFIDVTDIHGRPLRDVSDSNGEVVDVTNSYGFVQNAYMDLKPKIPLRAVLEQPDNSLYDELETLVLDLEDGKLLTFAPIYLE